MRFLILHALPTELSRLDDDEPEGLLVMCSIIHHRPENLPSTTIPQQAPLKTQAMALSGLLSSTVKLADKYDCMDAIQFWANHTLSQLDDLYGEPDVFGAPNLHGKQYP